jgi:hypothetical protein
VKTKTIRITVTLRVPADSDADVRGAFKDLSEALVRGSMLDDSEVDDVGYKIKVREWPKSS